MANKTKTGYAKLNGRSNHCIYKSISLESYQVRKKINGKTVYRSGFNSLHEARRWRDGMEETKPEELRIEESKNGKISSMIFEEVLNEYRQHRARRIKETTKRVNEERYTHFFNDQFLKTKMHNIDREYILYYLKLKVLESKASKNNKRYNFDKELEDLKAIFHFYQSHIDTTFFPIITRNTFEYFQSTGTVRVKQRGAKLRCLSLEQTFNFFENLRQYSPVFHGLGFLQYRLGLRIGEAAGLCWEDFNDSLTEVEIKHTLVWVRRAQATSLQGTKTESVTKRSIPNDLRSFLIEYRELYEELKLDVMVYDLLQKRSPVFHKGGQFLRYRGIQYAYGKALKQIGVTVESSTHFLRHGSIQHLRDGSNNLDLTQAFSQHADRRTVEKTYGKQPIDGNKKATETFEEIYQGAYEQWKKTGTQDDFGTILENDGCKIINFKNLKEHGARDW